MFVKLTCSVCCLPLQRKSEESEADGAKKAKQEEVGAGDAKVSGSSEEVI